MDNSYYIREATLFDIDMLVELRKILLNQGSGHYVAHTLKEKEAWQLSYRRWIIHTLDQLPSDIKVIVACELQLGVVGCAIGIIDKRVPIPSCLNGRIGWIQTVAVLPEHRGQGIAQKLMHFMFSWFKDQDTYKVTLQTTPMAESLYYHLGFKDSGEPLLVKSLSDVF